MLRANYQQHTHGLLRKMQPSVEQNPLFNCREPHLFLQQTPPPVAKNPASPLFPLFFLMDSPFFLAGFSP